MKIETVLLFSVWFVAAALAQQAPAPGSATPVAAGISGMYTFLEEGEFIQITVEEQDKVTGFISRYSDQPGQQRAFLDQFIKKGTLAGNELSFVTEPLHGVEYEFKGAVIRGPGKAPGDEAYYVLKGTLIQTTRDEKQHATTRAREVEFKSFPQDALPTSPNPD